VALVDRFAVVSRRIVAAGRVQPGAVVVAGGRIEAVADEPPASTTVVDVGADAVMAGLVDSHVHLNDPGRTHWEGFATGTAAAAAGGITTLVDMPLNSIPPTTTVAGLAAKQAAAQDALAVDVALWGGIVPDNEAELGLLAAGGVCGFKAFLVASGVPEFPAVTLEDLDRIMPVVGDLGLPLLVHAELAGPMAQAADEFAGSPLDVRRRCAAYAESRPQAAEVEAIEALAELVRRHGTATHVLHLAAGDAMAALLGAQDDGLPITAETCPHYLILCADEVADGDTAAKCAPPIRDAANRERLWNGLVDGTIAMVVSDHSPAPEDLKASGTGDFAEAWGGISSLELRLPLVWTAARQHGIGLERLAPWLCERPAALAGLPGKGVLEPGADADLVIWDPEAAFTVDPAALRHRHPVSPYAGRTVYGKVTSTYLGGRRVYPNGLGRAGRLIAREAR
jgi:allantoinase